MLRLWAGITLIVLTVTLLPGLICGAWTPFIGAAIAMAIWGGIWGVIALIDPL